MGTQLTITSDTWSAFPLPYSHKRGMCEQSDITANVTYSWHLCNCNVNDVDRAYGFVTWALKFLVCSFCPMAKKVCKMQTDKIIFIYPSIS